MASIGISLALCLRSVKPGVAAPVSTGPLLIDTFPVLIDTFEIIFS